MECSGFDEEFVKNDAPFSKIAVKRGKLSAESITAFFLGITKVTILNAIKDNVFSDSHFPENYLSELQVFLENCLANNCYNARFKEFLSELFLFEKKNLFNLQEKKLVDVQQHFISGCQFFIDLSELASQVESQINQIIAITNSFPSDENDLIHLRYLDAQFFVAHYTCFLESTIEYRENLANYVNDYWLYSPIEVHAFIQEYSNRHTVIKGTSFEPLLSSELLAQYENSTIHLKSCVSKAIQTYQNSPKLTIADFNIPFEKDVFSETTNSSSVCLPIFDTSYTLNDLLDRLVEETKHDAINRGEFVGRELW